MLELYQQTALSKLVVEVLSQSKHSDLSYEDGLIRYFMHPRERPQLCQLQEVRGFEAVSPGPAQDEEEGALCRDSALLGGDAAEARALRRESG